MEISQITGAGKDPVARVEDDPQLKNIGAIPAAHAIKKDGDSKQSTPEPPETVSFEHLRREPLHLLLRAISTRLAQMFGAVPASRSFIPTVDPALTPEIVSARVLILVGAAFGQFKTQNTPTDAVTLLTEFLPLATNAVQDAEREAREVLRNLNLLDDCGTADINKAVMLTHAALARFTG